MSRQDMTDRLEEVGRDWAEKFGRCSCMTFHGLGVVMPDCPVHGIEAMRRRLGIPEPRRWVSPWGGYE